MILQGIALLAFLSIVFVGAKAMLKGAERAAELEAEDQRKIKKAKQEDREIDKSELNIDPDTGLRQT